MLARRDVGVHIGRECHVGFVPGHDIILRSVNGEDEGDGEGVGEGEVGVGVRVGWR